MRGLLLAIVGLAIGAMGALGYSHYLGEGKQLADAQAALAEAQANLAKAANDTKAAKTENTALSDQIEQLSASKADLQKQLAAAKASAQPAAAPAQPTGFAALFANMGGRVQDMAAQRSAARLEALKRRLNLTPEQEAAIKAAMDAQDAKAAEMAKKMFSGQSDPKTAIADAVKEAQNEPHQKTPDEVINEVLTPEQKTTYQQMQTEEKNSAMETRLTSETNEMAPTLGLNESQKDQVYSALGQAEAQTQDPAWIKAHSNPDDPVAMLDAQQKAKEDALAKILTPDQLAAWKKQADSQLQMQRDILTQFKGISSQLKAAAAPTTPVPQADAAATPPPASQ